MLLTMPLSARQLIFGKYFGNLVLVLFALLPTLLYVLTIDQLGKPTGNFDIGSTLGSYLGLIFLGGVFTAIGLFASSLSKNQIVAFIRAVLLCFLCFFAFKGLADTALFGSVIYSPEYLRI